MRYTHTMMKQKIKVNGVEYELGEVVYHWGTNASDGSEHTVDSKRYAGEMQLLMYQSNRASNYSQALQEGAPLAAVALFLQVAVIILCSATRYLTIQYSLIRYDTTKYYTILCNIQQYKITQDFSAFHLELCPTCNSHQPSKPSKAIPTKQFHSLHGT